MHILRGACFDRWTVWSGRGSHCRAPPRSPVPERFWPRSGRPAPRWWLPWRWSQSTGSPLCCCTSLGPAWLSPGPQNKVRSWKTEETYTHQYKNSTHTQNRQIFTYGGFFGITNKQIERKAKTNSKNSTEQQQKRVKRWSKPCCCVWFTTNFCWLEVAQKLVRPHLQCEWTVLLFCLNMILIQLARVWNIHKGNL